MSLRDVFGKKQDSAVAAPAVPAAEASAPPTVVEPSAGLLDLNKNVLLNLSKTSPKLEKIRVAAGWDLKKGDAYDLDVAAYLCKGSSILKTVFYANMAEQGISLDGDNRTGAGDGDDETITINLGKINDAVDHIVFAVVIYKGSSLKQYFENVENAFTRIIDDTNGGTELCRFRLTENGGKNTAVITGEMTKENGEWIFHTIGDYSVDSIESLRNQIKNL